MKFLFTLFIAFSTICSPAQEGLNLLKSYDRYWELPDSIYRVFKQGKVGIVNKTGQVIVPCEFDQVWSQDMAGNIKVLNNSKQGLYHISGRKILSPVFDQISAFKNNRTRVIKNGKIGYYSLQGIELIPCIYDQIWYFNDGKAKVLKEGKIGYINNHGQEVIPVKYEQIEEFKDGTAKIVRNGRMGLINDHGLEVIPPIYSKIFNFENGHAKALAEGKLFLINKKGDIIKELDSSEIEVPVKNKKTSTSDSNTILKIWNNKIEVVDQGRNTKLQMTKQHRKNRGKFKGHWMGIDIGYNGYLTAKSSFNLPQEQHFLELNYDKSVEFSLNPFQHSINLSKNNIGLVTGLGFTFNNYRFDSEKLLIINPEGDIDYTSVDKEVKKNKLATLFVNVPLLMEFQIPMKKESQRVYISGGAIAGFKLKSHTKLVYNDQGSKTKEKSRGAYNLNSFRYGITGRIGYRAINFYATYFPSPLFKTDNNPELYPFSAGLSIYFPH